MRRDDDEKARRREKAVDTEGISAKTGSSPAIIPRQPDPPKMTHFPKWVDPELHLHSFWAVPSLQCRSTPSQFHSFSSSDIANYLGEYIFKLGFKLSRSKQTNQNISLSFPTKTQSQTQITTAICHHPTNQSQIHSHPPAPLSFPPARHIHVHVSPKTKTSQGGPPA